MINWPNAGCVVSSINHVSNQPPFIIRDMYADCERVVAGGLVTLIRSSFEVARASEYLLLVALIGRQYRGLAKCVKRKCAQKKRQEKQGKQVFFVGFGAFCSQSMAA